MNKYIDNRGELLFLFKNNIIGDIKQCTVSKNKKHVFRGFHKNNFDKLITCIQGKMLDIIINLDETSVDYLKPQYYNLDPNTEHSQIFVPRNHLHGFLTLEEDTILIYHFNGMFADGETKHIHYMDPTLNIALPISNPIISEKDNIKNFIKPIDYIIIGGTGYLGNHIFMTLKKQMKNVIKISTRLENIEDLKKQLTLFKPKYVINAAGLTGLPNIDWCDDNKEKTIETNITYQLTLCHICKELNIHLTILGSGGIFKGNVMRKEEDQGDFTDKFYSEARIYLENICKHYDNVLYLRINYPLSSCINKKNLLVKVLGFKSVTNKPMSITCVDTLFPILTQIIENGDIGIINFVNPGTTTLLKLKKAYNDSCGDTKKIVINNNPNRSCPILDSTKIEKYNPLSIEESIVEILGGGAYHN